MTSAAAAASTSSATASVATRSRGSPRRARRRVAPRPSSAAPSRESVVTSASSGPPPAALVVGHDADETRATADAVSRALDVRAVCLLHDAREGGSCPSGARLPCRPGLFPGAGELVGGTAGDAAVCGSDPTSGLVASLGFACVVCVVGVAREPCLGEDAAGAGATRAGRRAAVTSGVPTVVAAVPTTSASAPVAGARDALERLLRVMRNNKTLSLEAPETLRGRTSRSPRTAGGRVSGRARSRGRTRRWRRRRRAPRRRAGVRERRLLVAGGRRERVRRRRRRSPSRRRGIESVDRRRRRTKVFRTTLVRCAPRCASVPGRGRVRVRERAAALEARGENGFAACRPGVLWRQERVRAEFSDESATRTRRAGDTNDTNDAFGRTLPLNTLWATCGGTSAKAAKAARASCANWRRNAPASAATRRERNLRAILAPLPSAPRPRRSW